MSTNCEGTEPKNVQNHYHVKDLMEALSDAQTKRSPIYAALGPCGGCDLVIEPKELDISSLMRKLSALDPLKPVYPCESAPCGGCDLCIPVGGIEPRPLE
jgi:hypothetical protein